MSAKNRLRGEIYLLVRDILREPFSKTRRSRVQVSEKTAYDRRLFYRRIPDLLYDRGLRLRKIRNLSSKHLAAFFDDWDERELSYHTIENYLTLLRKLVERIDRPNLLREIETYNQRKALEARARIQAVAAGERPSAWSAREVDVENVVQRVCAEDSVVALQLAMQHAFGLRVRESHRFRPADDWREDRIMVHRGTKGGRARVIPISDPSQTALLEHARAVADAISDVGSLMPAAYTERQWRNRYYGVLRKCGVTKRQLGVTSHGLRHEYAQRIYEQAAGVPAPAVTGARAYPDREASLRDLAARREVAEHLGHGRYDITRAYLDTIQSMGGLVHGDRQRRHRGTVRRANALDWPTAKAC